MNLAKGSVFWNSRFLFELHKASGFHKACLWSSLKYSTIVDQMLKIHEFQLLETMLGIHTQCWRVRTWRHRKNYTGWNFSLKKKKKNSEVWRSWFTWLHCKTSTLYLVMSQAPSSFLFLNIYIIILKEYFPPLIGIYEP